MGRIYKSDREVQVWVADVDERGKAVPLKTNVTERFPRLSRRDRRRLAREGAKLVARQGRTDTSVPKEERRVILTDEVE